jgi:hypothetical protein
MSLNNRSDALAQMTPGRPLRPGRSFDRNGTAALQISRPIGAGSRVFRLPFRSTIGHAGWKSHRRNRPQAHAAAYAAARVSIVSSARAPLAPVPELTRVCAHMPAAIRSPQPAIMIFVRISPHKIEPPAHSIARRDLHFSGSSLFTSEARRAETDSRARCQNKKGPRFESESKAVPRDRLQRYSGRVVDPEVPLGATTCGSVGG